MIRDVYLDVLLRLHLPDGLTMLEPAPAGSTHGVAPTREPVHVITAFNPHGRVATETDNARSHRALVERLRSRGIASHPAAGGDRSWRHVEPGVVIIGLPRAEAVALGKDFGQDAIFEWTADALSVISCTDDSVVELGWRRIVPDDRAAGVDRAWRELGLPSPYESIALASSALDRTLETADAERAAMLHALFAHLADDFWAPRVAAQEAASERRKKGQAAAAHRDAVAGQEAEERRGLRRAQRRAARKSNEVQHDLHVRQGWPATWRPRTVDQWVALGGDAASACRWADSGWSATEVVAAARAAGGTAYLPVVPGSPEHHAAWGDGLHDIALGGWPAAPAETLVSVKRTFPDGRRERWFVLPAAEDGVRVVRLVRDVEASWREEPAGEFPTVEAAFAGVRELSRVDAGIVCEVSSAADLGVDLLHHLRMPRTGLDVQVDGVADRPAAELLGLDLEAIARAVEGVPSRLVHCTVDGVAVVAVRTGRGWRWLRVDDNGTDDGELVGETVAECRWLSESGGGPISWDGGNSLQVVAPGLAVARQWGDLGEEREFVAWPQGATERAAVLADWITGLDLETVAALVLETWPSREQWLEWYDVSIWLELAVEDDVLEALRRRLAKNTAYQLARHAVRHPRSRAGRALATALEEARLTGFTGRLYGGQWFERPVSDSAESHAPSSGDGIGQ